MMLRRSTLAWAGVILLAASVIAAPLDDATRKLARDIFRELIEINTTDSSGSTTAAAEAMRKRLLEAGFAPGDAQVLGPNARKGNLVARLHGSATRQPVLILGHLDVVEARREDWTTNPFEFVEKDGYFYGRGTKD
ncbi:MAG: M20/M25/M40 family metallo-hydrolase, partial [Terriglobales bacterium]